MTGYHRLPGFWGVVHVNTINTFCFELFCVVASSESTFLLGMLLEIEESRGRETHYHNAYEICDDHPANLFKSR